ncbi:GNAT family N-acetyltransferase [Halomicroarcula sp. S1AR25-4]|uniref:GNAT family N-acetyltransferase n=1 Tax=Haloarcula sp. S1AR25-4 TaxID=2950538 RepID=UPI0028768670|nr:GNAT family N-acetyltransferase [Halomicroarcula sp. S1AR25-4]MDS0280047.1 GNAT family N-acetyltransferase [Halomicroarcula sp. S1AR25-4]
MAADTTTTTPRREWGLQRVTDRDDAFYVSRQWEHYFGVEYESDTRLPWPLAHVLGWNDGEDPAPIDAAAYVATHEQVRVGCGLASLRDHTQTVDALPQGRFSPGALAGDRNGWLLLGAVDPAWRGHGIGHALFDARLDWLAARDPDMVFAFGWERDAGRSSRPLFEAHDFTPIQRFERYYADDSDGAKRTSCPDCGAWRSNDVDCQCPTTLWALDGADLQRIATRQNRQTTSDCYEADS